jgi:hypothetical protein
MADFSDVIGRHLVLPSNCEQLVTGIDPQILADWLTMRAAKRAAVTKVALTRIAGEATKVGLTLAQAITYSCKKNWIGFKADWWLKDNPVAIQTKRTENEA